MSRALGITASCLIVVGGVRLWVHAFTADDISIDRGLAELLGAWLLVSVGTTAAGFLLVAPDDFGRGWLW